jgi:hypothetical protein
MHPFFTAAGEGDGEEGQFFFRGDDFMNMNIGISMPMNMSMGAPLESFDNSILAFLSPAVEWQLTNNILCFIEV